MPSNCQFPDIPRLELDQLLEQLGQIRDARLADHDRIASDLHDHVIGELFAVGMGLQGLAGATHDPARAQRLGKYLDGLDRVISTIRTAIFQLQPRRHDPTGLQTRILAIADTHTEQLGYRPQLHFSGPLDHINNEPLATDILAVNREALKSPTAATIGNTYPIRTGSPTFAAAPKPMEEPSPSHGGTRLTCSAHCTPPRELVGAAG